MGPEEQLEAIRFEKELCESGNAGLISGQMVDLRTHPNAEPFTIDAMKKIAADLQIEEDKLLK